MTEEKQAKIPSGMMMAWPTPILRKHWPEDRELAERLKEIIQEKQRNDPGIVKAQVGGWHSEADLLGWGGPDITQLRQRLGSAVEEMLTFLNQGLKVEGRARISAWANISQTGDFHSLHSHPNHTLSGVYYIDTGEPEQGHPVNGELQFVDPRLGVEMDKVPGAHFGKRITVVPEVGLLLLFPSWLQHYVNPFYGAGARISVAFNVLLMDVEAGPKV